MPEGLTLEQYQQVEVEMNQRAARRGFAVHAFLYFISMILFVTIDLAATPEVIWFPYPMVGWGIGLLIHYLTSVRWSGDIRTHQRAVEKRAEHLAG